MDKQDRHNKTFLGRGWSFPPTFSNSGVDAIIMVENEIDITQSIEILLNTTVGERVMLPDYGCDLQAFLFESIDNTKINFLKTLISTAIIKYESRIDLHEVFIDSKEYLDGIMKIGLDYTIITTNTRFNLVFPYYKLEGTDIPQLFHKKIIQTAYNDEK